jgi:Myo-inositol-1-phosphate synthase
VQKHLRLLRTMTTPHTANNAETSGNGSGSDGETSSSVHSSTVSVTSSVRHASAGPFAPPLTSSSSLLLRRPQSQLHPQQLPLSAAATPPQVSIPLPVLSKDVHHQPKTTGRVGILVVGLGGANGATMAAGILANRHGIEWYGPRGQAQSPNWYGCLTQLHPDDTLHYGIGYRDQVAGLADASLAAIGGWVRVCWLLEQSITTGDCVSRFLLIFSRSLSSFHACLMALAHQQLFFLQ